LAAQALGEIGDATAAQALAESLADPAWKASDGAATALVKLGQPALAAVRALEQETEDPAVKTRCQRVIEAIEADQEA
jgi:HEAT repeat protein